MSPALTTHRWISESATEARRVVRTSFSAYVDLGGRGDLDAPLRSRPSTHRASPSVPRSAALSKERACT
jgi:hypothetical protein